MRIVHLIPQLRLGAGRYVVDLALRQADVNAVEVLLSEDAEPPFTTDPALVAELAARGIPVGVAGDFFHRNLGCLNAAAARVRQAVGPEPWIAHAHTAMAAATARRAAATVVVSTCHGVAPGRAEVFDLQDALAWRACDRVTTPSRAWASRLEDHFGVAGVAVIPVGVDLRKYRELRRTRSGSALRLVAVAEHTHRKGLDVLIDALPRVWARGLQATCYLFGRGDAADALESQARAVDPHGERIVFEGHVERPYERLGAFDAFVLPSRSDNQPVSAIEAMLAGLPLIVSDAGGLGDLARDADAGWVVPAGDADAISEAILAAGEAGPAGRSAYGARGQAYARRTFDIEATFRSLAAIYEQGRRAAAVSQ